MSKYNDQLTGSCENPQCVRAFCRKVTDKSVAKKISKILSAYGDRLLCENIQKQDLTDEKLNKNLFIDCLFYVNWLIVTTDNEDKSPTTFDFRDAKLLNKIQSTNDIIGDAKMDESNCENRGNPTPNVVTGEDVKGSKLRGQNGKTELDDQCASTKFRNLDHKFCRIMSKTRNQVDSYLLVGILHILLSKFKTKPSFNLSILICRLFGLISTASEPDNSYFNTLLSVFTYIKEKILTPVGSSLFKDNAMCGAGRCLLCLNLSIEDFRDCVKTVTQMLDSTFPVDFKHGSRLPCLFDILSSLFEINEHSMIIEKSSFLLKRFFSTVNLKNEIKSATKVGYRSSLDYPFAIPIEVKAEILKVHNGDCMKTALQDAFFKALFDGITQPYLFINVRRDRVYEDTLKIMSDINDVDIKKQLKVKFLGEEGVDSGGIKKEYFLLISHEIENDTGLFAQTNNRLWFRKGIDLKLLNAIGKLVGIALYNDVVLSVPLPFLLFKKLLSIPLDLGDLEEIEPEVHNSLCNLQKCTTEDLEFLDQNFTADIEVQGRRVNYELCDGGKGKQVTMDNLNEFVYLYWTFLMERVIADEFGAFADGFFSVVKFENIRNMKPCELEKILMGVDDIDFNTIKEMATYNGYEPEDRIVAFFWEFFYEMEVSKKKKLIQFITGNDRLPVGGSKALNLVIMRNGCDTDRLPSSQTCFNTLLLPAYSTKEKLRDKLGKAVNLTAGFFLL